MATVLWARAVVRLLLLFILPALLLYVPALAGPLAQVPGPAPAAARTALLIHVAEGGLQRLSGADLAAVGLDLATLDPTRLWLRYAGRAVPLDLRSGSDGRLDPTDELRFYAPNPADRWNPTATYWLTVEPDPGPRIIVRAVPPAQAPLRSDALELGEHYQPLRYDSRRPGPDGDHWFAADLRPTQTSPVTHSLDLETSLPPLPAATTLLTVSGQLYVGGPVSLSLALGPAQAEVAWVRMGLWTSPVALVDGATAVLLTAHVASGQAALLLDRVTWERPARLELGGQGVRFRGLPGNWRYSLSGLPLDWELYDVSDPAAPLRLDPGGTSLVFEDGPTPHDYLVSGPGTLFVPTVTAWAGSDIASPRSAEVLYLVPAALREALAPLVAHRTGQGYAVAVVSVEDVYAGWSYAAVDPAAIRAFLRYAASTWPQPPTTLVLVGDGSVDPHDWTGRGAGNRNLIPPYMASVDPWLVETACDTCYGRLAGDDPLQQDLPDLAVGRLPVKSAEELAALVSKLIAYDRSNDAGAWRDRLALIAEEPDTAGDFFAAADAAAALQPPQVVVQRVFYDPSGLRGPASAEEAARQTRAAFEDGATVLVYHGHSHQWQWALTALGEARSSLLSLYEPDTLGNHERLPVVLTMTCLSSAFQTPAISGTTIDERLVLAPGGAVAVWGPSGFGVAHGHVILQQGFFAALWAAPEGRATLGELTMAGYRAIQASDVAHDTLFTFVLLGDPLTSLGFGARGYLVNLPLVLR